MNKPRIGMVAAAWLTVALLPAAATAKAKAPRAPAAPPESERIDTATWRDQLRFLTDGKGHLIALIPFGSTDHVFYGDGKRFFGLRVGSYSSAGKESFDFTFWEPRVAARYQAGVALKDGKWTVQCGDRITPLELMSDADSGAMASAAAFYKPSWKFRAYALARDDRGTYYYVDRQREPEDSLVFRVFRGPRGNLRPLKMKNVVSDSGGEIFATASGELRLVLDRKESLWVKGKSRLNLASLPIEDNAVLIYRDLGAYLGQRLGTPCDDF